MPATDGARIRIVVALALALASGSRLAGQETQENESPNGAAPPPAQEEFAPQGPQVKKLGEAHRIRRLELKEAKVVDAVRLIAEISGINVVTTRTAGEKEVTLYLQNVTAAQAIETLSSVSGLWFRRDEKSRTFRIMTTEEYQKDLVVFREDITKVFTLRHPNAVSVALSIESLYGERVFLTLDTEGDDLLSGSLGFGGILGTGGFGPGAGGLGATGLRGQGVLGARSAPLGDFGFGARGGLGGFGNRQFGSSFGGSGRFSRPGSFGGRFSRSVGGGRSGAARDRENEQLVDEELTPQQIAELEKRLAETPGEEVSSDILRGITKREQPIYIAVNREHNVIAVRTSDGEVMQDIEKLILDLDRPTPQVLLEMKILELAVGKSFRAVFDLDYQAGSRSMGPDTVAPRNPRNPTAIDAAANVLGAGNFPLEGGTLVYQYLNDHIRARMQLLEEENRIDVIATPMILASNNRPATLFIGEERVLTTGVSTDVITPATGATTAAVTPVTEIRDIGVTLFILPRITSDRTVTLTVTQDASSVKPDAASIPVATAEGGIASFDVDSVDTATLTGTVVAKDRLTVAVGGLIRTSVSRDVEKVPVLGDIPVLGQLFRSEVKDREKTELVLLITPHILTTPEEGQTRTRERLRSLSQHPYRNGGDSALDSYFPRAPEDNGENEDE